MTLVDFLSVKTILKKNSNSVLVDSKKIPNKISGPSESFDDFLDKLNLDRVVNDVFKSDEMSSPFKRSTDELASFHLEVDKGIKISE